MDISFGEVDGKQVYYRQDSSKTQEPNGLYISRGVNVEEP